MYVRFLKYRAIYFILAGILTAASIVALVKFGLNPGIDFTGGSILEIAYAGERPDNNAIAQKLAGLDLGTLSVQPTGDKGVIVRMKEISEETHQTVLQKLGEAGDIEERRFESTGPVIGEELKQKTKVLIAVALLAIVIYIAFAFRKVQRPVNSWQYGVTSLVALIHDVLIPLGVFAVLGKFYGIQITIPVVASLLTVIGYSINNVVVVFDRIRENLVKRAGVTFEETIDKSLNQTLTRCLSTSLTTLFPLVAIFFWGGDTLKYFALALAIGILAGLYSSLFLASPLLAVWLKWRHHS